MVLLPTGFGLPPLPHLLALLVAGGLTVWLLYRRHPPVTAPVVAAFAPWMAAGGGLYALFQVDAVPSTVAPFFGSPAVYLSVGILAGLLWVAVADRPATEWTLGATPGVLLAAGVTVVVATLVAAAAVGLLRDSLQPFWPAVAVVVSVLVTAALWIGLRNTTAAGETGVVGLVVVFGHALDGISTAVGLDVLGFTEQTPLSRIIVEFAATVTPAIGGGWLFAVVKLLVASAVVVLFVDYVREEPTEGYLLLGVVAAVGLGPGVHNLVLFTIA